MDRFTIRAVDDVHKLGLDRDAAAMLLIESDLPGVAASDEIDAAERVCDGRRRDARDPGGRSPGGRLAAPGPPARVPGARASRRGADGGRRRAAQPRARDAAGDRGASANATGCGSAPSAMPAMATSTRRSCWNGTRTSRRPSRGSRRRGATSTKRPSRSAGRSRASTGSASARRDWLVRQRGEDAVAVMRAIKHALDPQDLLNPGRVLA